MNNSRSGRYDPLSELQSLITRSHNDSDVLEAHLHLLPEIIITNPKDAVTLATNAHRIALKLFNWEACAKTQILRADAYLRLCNPTAALAILQDVSKQPETECDATTITYIFLSMGRAYMMLGNPAEARKWMERALGKCGPEMQQARADALESLADFHISAGACDLSMAHLREAQVIRENLGDRRGIGRILCAIGGAYGSMNELEQAYDYYQLGLNIFQDIGDNSNVIRTLANMAGIQQSRNDLKGAIETALKGLAACEGGDDGIASAHLTITVADIHQQQGSLDAARDYYIKAFHLLQKYPDDRLLLGLYERIGALHEQMNDLDAAERVYRLALPIADNLQERQSQFGLNRSLSGVYERQGCYQEALWHHQRFAALQDELAGDERRRNVSSVQGQYDRKQIEQDLEIARQRISQLEDELHYANTELTQLRVELASKDTEAEKASRKLERLHELGMRDPEGIIAGSLKKVKKSPAKNKKAPREESDDEWEKLKRQIQKSYPHLEKTLFDRCPELTLTEVKICLLTRLFSDDTARIAQVLGNQFRTVQTQRLNIRKKFRLRKDVVFTTFIKTL